MSLFNCIKQNKWHPASARRTDRTHKLLHDSSLSAFSVLCAAAQGEGQRGGGNQAAPGLRGDERKIDVTNKSVLDLLSKTTDYLQPNPASRAKLNMLNTMSKIRGQVKTTGYPQAEGLLGDCMLRHGQDLGEDSIFGCALTDVGEAMRQVAHVKDSLDISVKQNFIDPLQHLQDKDLKEITHHLKKLEGRRLDLDYKKKRQGKIPDEEIRQAVEKFDESRELAERSMFHFLENDLVTAADELQVRVNLIAFKPAPYFPPIEELKRNVGRLSERVNNNLRQRMLEQESNSNSAAIQLTLL
ncbi:hypothetical protein KUCAC02_001381 [Chaenocephalus aceratus]|uniref:Uncharacterized protein n=1 Tax=Chaenocephalus aceratus TaxID=36190 RepID=A0ACB9XQG4_CHAAC|nr:hypothetical protein KUCAC02_001381 [Chaenocephalus aceratus]